MGKILDTVVASRAADLEAGEQFLAAGRATDRANRLTLGQGAPRLKGVRLVENTIWAASARRLFIWKAKAIGSNRPDKLLVTLDIATEIESLGRTSTPTRGSQLALLALGTQVVVQMDAGDAQAIAEVVRKQPPDPHPIGWADPTRGDLRVREVLPFVAAGDWETVELRFDAITDPHERALFLDVVTDEPSPVTMFEEWVRNRPDRSTPYLFRGAKGTTVAWSFRSRARAEDVPVDAWPLFFQHLERAETDLFHAIALDPEDPLPWVELLPTGKGREIDKADLYERFAAADGRCPRLYPAYTAYLQGIAEKWGGSHEEMFSFARSVAASAPDGSPVIAILVLAHVEQWVADLDDGAKRGYWDTPAVRHEIEAVAQRTILHPAWQDQPWTLDAANAVAFGAWASEQKELRRAVMQRLGNRRTDMPWAYLGDAERFFAAALRR